MCLLFLFADVHPCLLVCVLFCLCVPLFVRLYLFKYAHESSRHTNRDDAGMMILWPLTSILSTTAAAINVAASENRILAYYSRWKQYVTKEVFEFTVIKEYRQKVPNELLLPAWFWSAYDGNFSIHKATGDGLWMPVTFLNWCWFVMWRWQHGKCSTSRLHSCYTHSYCYKHTFWWLWSWLLFRTQLLCLQ